MTVDLDAPLTTWAAVGFDLDDTLFDHHGAATAGAEGFIRELGGEPHAELLAAWFDLEAEHFESWRTGKVSFLEQRRRRIRGFLPFLERAAPDEDDAVDALFGRYVAAYRASWRAFDDAVPLLTRLRAQGVRVGVLTNGSEPQQLDKLAAIGLRPLVDVVCASEQLGVWKPDPRAFEALADRLDVPIGSMAFVGDNPEHDVAGARQAGMAAGLVDRTAASPLRLLNALRSAQRG
ncbi:HAD family hydrolase [Microbacterium sp. NEAU-LLC]|uniref:HAD family hydrolase n=1 Tax=Microbacterium helvum TaxID=2773713 RepID=A0ABR8NIB3_9MICO|nr:HAD family hydrolase [Microbacterium helvum]MBD3940420.1 HAD family hydrolase [Microbacterium helvum]